MQLCFQVVGALIGFKYRIVLQEIDNILVIQRQEINMSLIDDSAWNVMTAELAVMDITKTDRFNFDIGVWDTHAGLSEEEELVVRYDASFPLYKREHALTIDNTTEWSGAILPLTPRREQLCNRYCSNKHTPQLVHSPCVCVFRSRPEGNMVQLFFTASSKFCPLELLLT